MRDKSSVTQSGREALFLGLLAILGFSGTMPATRVCVRELEPLLVALGRAVGGGALAAMTLLLLRAPLPAARDLGPLGVVSLTTVIGFPLLSAWALTTVPASDAALVLAFVPSLTAAVAALRDGERPHLGFWLSSAVGLAALSAFFHSGGLGLGHGLLFLSAVLCAFGYTEGARLSRRMPGLVVASWALVITLPVLVPVLLTLSHRFEALSAPTWVGLGYVSFISMFLAFVPWYAALTRGGIALTSQLQLLQPLFSVIWAALLLAEPIGPGLALTLAIVIGAIVVSRRRGAAALPHVRFSSPAPLSSARKGASG